MTPKRRADDDPESPLPERRTHRERDWNQILLTVIVGAFTFIQALEWMGVVDTSRTTRNTVLSAQAERDKNQDEALRATTEEMRRVVSSVNALTVDAQWAIKELQRVSGDMRSLIARELRRPLEPEQPCP